MTAAKFITFEGGEGSGKSTQARLLAEQLRAQKIEVTETREPGGSPFAERLRATILDPQTEPHSALAEALLFFSARSDHLDQTIRPALRSGTWVICDRFHDSTRVYQGYAGDLDHDTLNALESIVIGQTRPDLTIILDVPAEIGMSRADQRRTETGDKTEPAQRDRFEARDIEFHTALRKGFQAIAANEPDRCLLVDAARAPDDIADEIWQAVNARILQSGE